MEPADASGMIRITRWQDAAQFAGKIIAYTTNNDFYISENGYSFDDSQIKYGFIPDRYHDWLACDGAGRWLHPNNYNKDRGLGYIIHQLVDSVNLTFSYKPLVDFRLKEAHLAIREVCLDELVSIHLGIKNKTIHFEGSKLYVDEAMNCLRVQSEENHLQEKSKIS